MIGCEMKRFISKSQIYYKSLIFYERKNTVYWYFIILILIMYDDTSEFRSRNYNYLKYLRFLYSYKIT